MGAKEVIQRSIEFAADGDVNLKGTDIITWGNVCLFLCGLSYHSRISNSYGDVNFTDEGLQTMTYTRHSWLLSSEGSLACHTYFDTGHPFIIVISEDPCHSNLLPSV